MASMGKTLLGAISGLILGVLLGAVAGAAFGPGGFAYALSAGGPAPRLRLPPRRGGGRRPPLGPPRGAEGPRPGPRVAALPRKGGRRADVLENPVPLPGDVAPLADRVLDLP